jgi:transcriptional regulator with XRE-family HTH domain
MFYRLSMPRHKDASEIDPLLLAIGKKMRTIREGQKISQEKFALKAGLERTYYAGIELGYRNVSAKNLVKIARCFGVEVGDLFPPVAELPEVTGGD